jgi:hypothetical protein
MLIGIIGKTNTGKSTFFKALTLAEVEIANRPFVTIKPNHGIGYVKINCVDKEFNVKCNPKEGYCINNNRYVPVELLDVAGLVPGAHKGYGLGNKFLDDLRQADAFIHVIDISGSSNEKGESIEQGTYDPANDIKFLEEEIDMWFFNILNKDWNRIIKEIRVDKKELHKKIAEKFSGLKITENMVTQAMRNLNVNDNSNWDEDLLKKFASQLRKISKPLIIAANKIDISGSEKNLKILKEKFKDYIIIHCSAESELALKEAAKHKLIKYSDNNFEIISNINEKQKNALDFIKKNILDKYSSTGVQEILDKTVFDLLKYITVYPVATNKLTDKDGNILPDCFLVPENITALEFAFKVHTDIGNNFIRAVNLKTKQIIGKDHILKNNDVIEIISSK